MNRASTDENHTKKWLDRPFVNWQQKIQAIGCLAVNSFPLAWAGCSYWTSVCLIAFRIPRRASAMKSQYYGDWGLRHRSAILLVWSLVTTVKSMPRKVHLLFLNKMSSSRNMMGETWKTKTLSLQIRSKRRSTTEMV